MSSGLHCRSLLPRLLVGALLLTPKVATAQQEYILVDLGTIDAGMGLPLSGLDNFGVHLNNITAPGFDPAYQLPAVQVMTMLDQQDLMTAVRVVNGQVTPLGTLGGAESIVQDVNFYPLDECRYLRLVGASQTVDSFFRAFIWDEVLGPTDLGTLGGDESGALAINDTRQVVGWAQDALGEIHASLWDGVTAPTDLNALLGETGPSIAHDIDNYGHIVGQAEYTGFAQATAWVRDINGILIGLTLGTLGGDESSASTVDLECRIDGPNPNYISVAGWAEVTPGGARHAALWDVDTILQVTAPTNLGTLGGTNSAALDFAHVGEGSAPPSIVGWSDLEGLSARRSIRSSREKSSAGNAVTHAFIWDTTNGMRDLNDLIDPNSGWELVRANSVNTSGMITGAGLVNGEYRAFRLDPINPVQACPSDVNGDGTTNVTDLLQLLSGWGVCP